MKLLISTHPFGQADPNIKNMLGQFSKVVYNRYNRKMTTEEIYKFLEENGHEEYILIAGTENLHGMPLTSICGVCRVGIGLDGVPLKRCEEFNIPVTWTPSAPSDAVAELTVAQMLNCLRFLPDVNAPAHHDSFPGWDRRQGRTLKDRTVGIIGCGRIGSRVRKILEYGFGVKKIMINDINLFHSPKEKYTKEEIYREADIITLHVPLTNKTKNMITKKELNMMKKDAVLINTSRGGIVNEIDLCHFLYDNEKTFRAALDVFEEEPYKGYLTSNKNCLISCHMGSMTQETRARMEREAVESALDILNNRPIRRRVPATAITENEYTQ